MPSVTYRKIINRTWFTAEYNYTEINKYGVVTVDTEGGSPVLIPWNKVIDLDWDPKLVSLRHP